MVLYFYSMSHFKNSKRHICEVKHKKNTIAETYFSTLPGYGRVFNIKDSKMGMKF